MFLYIGLSLENHKSETLRSVCQQKKWSEDEILKWLRVNCQDNNVRSDQSTEESPDFGNNLNQWCNYIQVEYLAKNNELLDEISSGFARVHKIHGNQYERLKNVHGYLEKLENKIYFYFHFQRQKFFPLINSLKDSKDNLLYGTIIKVRNGIAVIEEDQGEILKLMDTIEKKGQGLKNPAGACSTLRILNANIKTLFTSLRIQIEMERKHPIPLIKQKLRLE